MQILSSLKSLLRSARQANFLGPGRSLRGLFVLPVVNQLPELLRRDLDFENLAETSLPALFQSQKFRLVLFLSSFSSFVDIVCLGFHPGELTLHILQDLLKLRITDEPGIFTEFI